MTNPTMEINNYELTQLLRDDICRATNRADPDNSWDAKYVELEYGNFALVHLEWVGGQTFFVLESNTDTMFPGTEITVDEILDIVL